MDLAPYFKSVIDQDQSPVVICDAQHSIVYMNPAAISRYAHAGGAQMVGSSILDCHSPETGELMKRILAWFCQSPDNNSVFEGVGTSGDEDVYMVALRGDCGQVIGYYERHDRRTWEQCPKLWPVVAAE